MSHIKIVRNHDASIDKLQQCASDIILEMAKQYQLSVSKFEIQTGTRFAFKASGITGFLDMNHTNIIFEAELGFLQSIFKNSIAKSLNAKLKEILEEE